MQAGKQRGRLCVKDSTLYLCEVDERCPQKKSGQQGGLFYACSNCHSMGKGRLKNSMLHLEQKAMRTVIVPRISMSLLHGFVLNP